MVGIRMDIDQEDILTYQRLPVAEKTVGCVPTPDLYFDQTLSESEASHSHHEIIASIEENELYSLEDDAYKTRDHAYRPSRTDKNYPYERSRTSSTSSDTSWSRPETRPYEGREIAPDLPIENAPRERPIIVEIPQSTLTQPKSIFRGATPSSTEINEVDALSTLLETSKINESLEYMEFDLQDFSIYLDSELYPCELRPLQHLATRQSSDVFYFDGTLVYDEQNFFLKKIPFRELPIGNYASEEHTVGDQIWIRSRLNEQRGHEIYYKLKTPSTEYIRFYEAFRWIADFTKHVLDYCDYLKEVGRKAVLYDFKSEFSTWILQKHTKSAAFKRWHLAHGNNDFRGALIANIDFIWKEAHGLDDTIVSWHTFWSEIKTFNRYKPNLEINTATSDQDSDVDRGRRKRSKLRRNATVVPTIVTPYVHDLFSHMIFGNILKPVTPSASVERKRVDFIRTSRPTEKTSPRAIKRDAYDSESFINSIKEGDVISTRPDDDNTDTEWKQQKSKHYEGEHLWFGLVQKIHRLPRGRYSFDVIWLYQPIDTPCGIMKYPWSNELFLSNNCTCHHGTARVKSDQILSTHEVEWFGNPSTSAEFFVRQTYLSDDCKWTTLQKEHLTCEEDRFHEKASYNIGDTVLVETNPKALQLETFIVESLVDEGKRRHVKLRKLLRRKEVDKYASNSPPNEVVYTDQIVEISSHKIFRHCLVRAFPPEETVSSPYDLNGTGDLFFMTHQEIETGEGQLAYIPLNMELVQRLRLGFDPSQNYRSQKLQGLDLFCGGGNLGRGLEDGGGIEMLWVNDICSEAIHTYMANCEPDTPITPFLGSVDDLLLRAMWGTDIKVPRPGDVQFISAGSPCPGFSLLTPDRTTNDQRKNQSLIASFAAYVDLYRPYYGILENVQQIVNTKNLRDTCVFSQLVCALVGLGYQVQVMFLDAWSFGAPQTRSRVFLVFSAPGFRMPKAPVPSHSHPPGTQLTKLGEMSCGRPFDSRQLLSTPFRYVTAQESIGDLPDIQDGKPDFCVGFPDHRLAKGFTPPIRKQLSAIPIHPWGMSFSKLWHGRPGLPPVMGELDRYHLFPPETAERTMKPSKGWGRIHPHSLLGTVATRCSPTDARMGTINHWQQNRPLTVLEIRRAQGFRDEELILGTPAAQWRIIGNSVSRQVSVALGLAVREAWYGTLFDEPHLPQTGLAASVPDALASIPTLEETTAPDLSVTTLDSLAETRGAITRSPSTSMAFEGLFVTPTSPRNSPSPTATPITTDSVVDFSDGEGVSRKRVSLYVETLTRRRKLSSGYEEITEKSIAIERSE
ncbi:S-adenosyl-L-methionine-dependent methyltransferase [Daldinia caldariorum]|uniref:S-adenosyl-L-methionine-dependent methyltransferase n=1 Tax=Daldinia caldariorum TaxID=326644 RepID=UPI002007EFC8|nr:S-adenosyl-L-methionine-dependent methyltransferase [Daldinia caldariorum]KAI1468378.1 S-adenosyl-L-methionine-dependent methyltransferase [Daldinia caldariorum]